MQLLEKGSELRERVWVAVREEDVVTLVLRQGVSEAQTLEVANFGRLGVGPTHSFRSTISNILTCSVPLVVLTLPRYTNAHSI